MNEHDTEIIRGLLGKLGYGQTEAPEEADLILYNTCSVRENPERRVYGQVLNLRELKAQRPDLIIGICGCMPQSKVERQKIVERLPHVDLVFGTHNIHRLPNLLDQVQETGQQVVEVWDEEGDIVEGLPVQREGSLKAFVTIIYGCDYRCTFCIVPTTRGRQRSRHPADILQEVQQLAAEGYKEVTLLGQTVDAYGKDLDEPADLAGLLWMLNDVPGIERIRFTTSHPRDITDDLIATLADADKVCEHLHLPVQAGNDRILKLMGRRYTRREYLDLVDRIRARVPDISITSDIIVGFPGETEAEFLDTISLVEQVRYDSAFTFMYSPRPGTGAPRLADQVPEDVKRERIHRLMEVQEHITRERTHALRDQVVEVLVEGRNDKDPEKLAGRTRSNKLVIFPGPDHLIGHTVPVQITQPRTWSLSGEVVQAAEVAQLVRGSRGA